MATYIQGLTDYIPQIQPFQPDYNFLANVLQTRQSKYDNSYNQLSSVYTSLLNSPMMRDADIKRKDELFKIIDRDVKKVSGLDLSLQQNVDTAMKVFEPFYNDKNIVNDMVKTKQYQNAVQKGESYKNCVDPAKCGGEYWETGMAELQYKAAEFRNTTDAEALGFQMPDYTPYYNWKKDAMKLAKELDYNVSQDHITGQWIVKEKNGNLVKGGLYNLYQNAYGSDPRVNANYNTQAYVQRKATVAATVGQYGSEEAAERVYINDMINKSSARVTKMHNEFMGISERMGEKIKTQTEKQKTTGITPTEAEALQILMGDKEAIDNSTKSLEETQNSINNNAESNELSVLRSRADNAAAFELKDADLMGMASTMALRGAEIKYEANPYGVATHTSNLALRNSSAMAQINHMYKKELISDTLKSKMTLWDYMHGITSGAISNNTEGVPVENANWSTTQLEEKDEYGVYNQNLATSEQFANQARVNSEDFIFNAFSTAKAAAANNKLAAQDYLKTNFGPEWNKITTKEDMINYMNKSKKSSTALFQSTINAFDASKNKSDDLSWASTFMNSKSEQVQRIKEFNTAKVLVGEHITNKNKEIVKSIQGQAGAGGKNYLYQDADLLLSDAGFLVSAPQYAQFEQKYKARYGSKGDPQAAFEQLTDKFLETYRTTKGVVLNQGSGLSGAGTATAVPMAYGNLSPLQPQNGGLVNAYGILTDLKNSGNFKAVIGSPDKDNIGSGKTSEALETFVTQNLLNDIQRRYAKDDKSAPIFNMIESPIAGNDPNTSAVTLQITNPKYLEQFVGTKNDPGQLYEYKDQLQNGITLYYNNKEVQTATTQALRADPLLEIVKIKGIDYDSWGDNASGKARYDQSTGMVMVDQTVRKYNMTNHKTYLETLPTQPVPLAAFKSFHNKQMAVFNQIQKANLMTDEKIRAFYLLHPELLTNN
jgi:hypothetical protein